MGSMAIMDTTMDMGMTSITRANTISLITNTAMSFPSRLFLSKNW